MRATFLWLLLALAGCAGTGEPPPQQFHYTVTGEARFWPGLPEPPRYRYVGELTGEENFSGAEGEISGMRRALNWLAGVDEAEDRESLQRPQGLVVDEAGRVFVSDISRQAVLVFDPVAGRLRIWSLAREGVPFKAPIGLALDANGGLLVADAELGAVFRLGPDGQPRGVIGQADLDRPTGVARDPVGGRIYVSDTRRHQVVVFDADGRFIDHWGQRGDEPGRFNAPTYLYLAEGRLYVADTLNSRVQILDARDGRWIRSIGRRGLYVGNFERPKGVAVDDEGNVYIVESYRDHLLIFDARGRFLLPIGGTGKGVGQFFLPAGVSVDSRNRIYVADMFNGRVVVFQYLGERE